MAVKNCIICGKEFEPTTSRQVYCSYECRYKSWYGKKQEEREEVVSICAYCGKPFTKKYSKQITHDQCAEHYRRKYYRERYRRQKAGIFLRGNETKLTAPIEKMNPENMNLDGAIALVVAIFQDAAKKDTGWILQSSQAEFLMGCIGVDCDYVRQTLCQQ